jgi:hypothetical protein
VQRTLGHKSAATTSGGYSDLFDDDVDAALDATGSAAFVGR